MQEGVGSVGRPEARLDDRTSVGFQNLDQVVTRMMSTRPEFSRMMIPSTDIL